MRALFNVSMSRCLNVCQVSAAKPACGVIACSLALSRGCPSVVSFVKCPSSRSSLSSTYCVQIAILWVCASLLLMRGICGVLSDYEGTEYTYMCAHDPTLRM